MSVEMTELEVLSSEDERTAVWILRCGAAWRVMELADVGAFRTSRLFWG